MFTHTTFKVLGIALSLGGTIILAARVTKILSALSMAVQMHDLNFQVRAERAQGNRMVPNIQMIGTSAHVTTAEETGVKLLVVGFALQIAGGLCNAAALLIP